MSQQLEVIENLKKQNKTLHDITHILHKDKLYVYKGFGGPNTVKARDQYWFIWLLEADKVSFLTLRNRQEINQFINNYHHHAGMKIEEA